MTTRGTLVVATARATIGEARYATRIHAGHHALIADEHAVLGGHAGPAPFALLLSALGSCTAITLKMYAERKQWPVEKIEVDLRYLKTGEAARIERVLSLEGALTEAQRARLADIAERTPVTLAIKGGVGIHTKLH